MFVSISHSSSQPRLGSGGLAAAHSHSHSHSLGGAGSLVVPLSSRLTGAAEGQQPRLPLVGQRRRSMAWHGAFRAAVKTISPRLPVSSVDLSSSLSHSLSHSRGSSSSFGGSISSILRHSSSTSSTSGTPLSSTSTTTHCSMSSMSSSTSCLGMEPHEEINNTSSAPHFSSSLIPALDAAAASGVTSGGAAAGASTGGGGGGGVLSFPQGTLSRGPVERSLYAGSVGIESGMGAVGAAASRVGGIAGRGTTVGGVGGGGGGGLGLGAFRPVFAEATTMGMGGPSTYDSDMGFNGSAMPLNPSAVFVDYTFYKGKSALSMKPIRPVFRRLNDGAFALQKAGTMFLTFAPATGTRVYDWQRKQIISLSVAEMGKIVTLKPGERAEFFHDPNMMSSNKGKVSKQLKIEPMDGGGFFFNLTVRDELTNSNERLNVPITDAEFAILRNAMNFIMPYCLGWHVFVDPATLVDGMVKDEDARAPYSQSPPPPAYYQRSNQSPDWS